MCDKKNSVLFTDTECLIMSPSFKLLDENQVMLRAPRQNGVYSLYLKNIILYGGITCLYANAPIDESKLWHKRLGHVNFNNINKLVKGYLVRGLPSKVFVNDHTCVACNKGKQHKASLESINKKKYCLVVTDDFSRFSWVLFLATKDETNEILYKFITCLENQLNHKVKIIRSDHGTKFKSHAMNELCAKKGIKREFSMARTPQQNGVAERKNRTLIEAARTILADSLLPIPFWAEEVNTACYVLNSVLVTKPQNKTPYELLIGKPPSISFMRPFGCPLIILNTLDSLGKHDGKSDEGYLLRYSTTSKAFRVYNKHIKRVEENMHIDFLEDQPNVAGSGPDWMFDPDFLTNTMNYIPISSLEKDKEPTLEYLLLPLHPHRPRILVEDVVQAAQEKPSENSPMDNDAHDSEDRMIAQEIAAKTMDDATKQAFKEEKNREAQATSINKLNTSRPSIGASNSPLVSTANIPYASAASTPTGANIGGSSFVYLGRQIPIDASTLPNADLPIDLNMPDLEDDSNVFPNDGIFSRDYDDEDVGAEVDFNNMDNTIDVSHIPILRVHKDHPKGQILGDPKLAVQTRGIEAIRLFLAFASFMGFPVYQMDVKSEFLFGTIEEEVYVHQPLGFVEPTHPNKVYKERYHRQNTVYQEELEGHYVSPSVKQQPDGIFISQDKYVANILKKFVFCSIKTATTPIVSNKPLVNEKDGVDVDVHVYRSMIGSLMYLTASRPDIMFAVCACARFQVIPKALHLNAVKRIFSYLKHQPKLGLWYPTDSIELKAFSDSDYGGASLDRKSTIGSCQFLGRRLISWQC
ncbi:putative ribonuclease H-like domain-containing protein [Tanacetum coccineum]